MIILTDKEIVLKREHKCIWCGEAIHEKVTCWFQKVVHDGGIQSRYWHLACYAAVLDEDAMSRGEEIDFTEYERKREEF